MRLHGLMNQRRMAALLTALAVSGLPTAALAPPALAYPADPTCIPDDYDYVYERYNEVSFLLPEPEGTEMRASGARVTAMRLAGDERYDSYQLVSLANLYEVDYSCLNARFQLWPTATDVVEVEGDTGATVNIYGRNLTSTTRVLLAGLETPFTVLANDHLQLTVPPGAGYGTAVVSSDDLPVRLPPVAVYAANGGARDVRQFGACNPAFSIDDVPSDSTHERTICYVVGFGLMSGTATAYRGNGYSWPTAFSGGLVMNRAQMATSVLQMMRCLNPEKYGHEKYYEDDSDRPPPFDDIEPYRDSHADNIERLFFLGVAKGTGPRTFSPAAPMTRGQMARVLAVAVEQKLGQDLPNSRDMFTDDQDSPFQTDINKIAQAGVATGRTTSQFDPNGRVTREQMATFLARSTQFLAEAYSGGYSNCRINEPTPT